VFFFQAEDGIRDRNVTGVQTCALPISSFHVGIDDKEAVQAIPFNRNAWAAGDGANGQGNRRSIHIEICYSMDNGYSGRYSKRHAQAEKNAALYVAHVLIQYGWGVDRLRQHWDWSRK